MQEKHKEIATLVKQGQQAHAIVALLLRVGGDALSECYARSAWHQIFSMWELTHAEPATLHTTARSNVTNCAAYSCT
jgi:hypothetical protein